MDENTVILEGCLSEVTSPSSERAPFRLRVETSIGSNRERHHVIAWKEAGDCSKLRTGDRVKVKGRLQTRSYEKDGTRKWVTEVIAATVNVTNAAAQGAYDDDPGPGF
jgi:single-stranded DNA-binding protein